MQDYGQDWDLQHVTLVMQELGLLFRELWFLLNVLHAAQVHGVQVLQLQHPFNAWLATWDFSRPCQVQLRRRNALLALLVSGHQRVRAFAAIVMLERGLPSQGHLWHRSANRLMPAYGRQYQGRVVQM